MAIHGSCIYCRILKNISTRFSYIKIYYFIYHIISSNIFTYFVRKGQEINLRMAYLQFSTLNWDIQYFKAENKMTHFSFKSKELHSQKKLINNDCTLVHFVMGHRPTGLMIFYMVFVVDLRF